MLIKNGTRYYEQRETHAYAQGYWDGRFHGVDFQKASIPAPCVQAYNNGFAHGEADYLEFDSPSETINYDDINDVAEYTAAHANIDPRKVNRYNK